MGKRSRGWWTHTMRLRVFALKWHTVTSTHFPFTQAILWPIRQWAKQRIPSSRWPRNSVSKSYRERNVLLRTSMQSTTIYKIYNYRNLKQAKRAKCLPSSDSFLPKELQCSFASYCKFIVIWFLQICKEDNKDSVGQEEVRISPYMWFILDSV